MSEVKISKVFEINRFTIKVLNTGLIVIEERPFKVKRKVKMYVPGEGLKEIEVEIPVWKYLSKHPKHAMTIHINELMNGELKKLSKVLPKYVIEELKNIIS